MSITSLRVFAAIATFAAICTTGAPSAIAIEREPPPPGYASAEVLSFANNSTLGFPKIPLRRGYYDGDADKGWGVDKAWHKHNLPTTEGLGHMARSTNATMEGTSFVTKTWAGYYVCEGPACILKKQHELRFVGVSTVHEKFLDLPAGGDTDGMMLGLQTAYCIIPETTRCPDWVWWALENPGKPSPFPPRRIRDREGRNAPILPDGAVPAYSYSPLPENAASTELSKLHSQ